MPQVESSGAKISYTIAGHGPTLVLVHGSVLGHQNTWMAVRQALEQRITLQLIARRGRGESTRTTGHSVEDAIQTQPSSSNGRQALARSLRLHALSFGWVLLS